MEKLLKVLILFLLIFLGCEKIVQKEVIKYDTTFVHIDYPVLDKYHIDYPVLDKYHVPYPVLDTIPKYVYVPTIYKPDTSKWTVQWSPNIEEDLAGYILHIFLKINKEDTSFSLKEPFPVGTYHVYMTAFDSSGNVSQYSTLSNSSKFKVSM